MSYTWAAAHEVDACAAAARFFQEGPGKIRSCDALWDRLADEPREPDEGLAVSCD
ncbi:MAG: hypothetical protein AAGG01_01885 [Planctomycetota bacterium]